MPIIYRIFPDRKLAYIRAWGEVTAEEIVTEGARMFAEPEWENGFNILCDYREISEFDLDREDVEEIVASDKRNEPLLDESRCAVVATDNLVFGISRMWEILSHDTRLTNMVFRDMDEAMAWLGLESDFPLSNHEEH